MNRHRIQGWEQFCLLLKRKIFCPILFSKVTSKGPPQLKSTRPCKTIDVIRVWVAGCDEHVGNLFHGLQWWLHRHLRPLLWHQPQEDRLCWGNAFWWRTNMFLSHVILLHLEVIKHQSSIMNFKLEHNIKVSCDILHSFTPGSSWFGLTDHSWSFYTDIGVLLLCLSWFCLELF